jgi:hypothetical protein
MDRDEEKDEREGRGVERHGGGSKRAGQRFEKWSLLLGICIIVCAG